MLAQRQGTGPRQEYGQRHGNVIAPPLAVEAVQHPHGVVDGRFADQGQLGHGLQALQHALADRAAEGEEAEIVPLSARIEAELIRLEPAERAEFLAELGIREPGLHRLIRAGYRLLDLITFFTTGPEETRAWTVPRGTTAPEAAGVIHSDFQRGFICAETIAYEDYVAHGGEQGAKEAGRMRQEGRGYVVRDGDILLFRFNV